MMELLGAGKGGNRRAAARLAAISSSHARPSGVLSSGGDFPPGHGGDYHANFYAKGDWVGRRQVGRSSGMGFAPAKPWGSELHLFRRQPSWQPNRSRRTEANTTWP